MLCAWQLDWDAGFWCTCGAYKWQARHTTGDKERFRGQWETACRHSRLLAEYRQNVIIQLRSRRTDQQNREISVWEECSRFWHCWPKCKPIVSEPLLLGGGSAGEVVGGQVAMLYTGAAYKLVQFSQPSQWALKHRSYYANNDTTSSTKLIHAFLHTPLSNINH